MSDDPHHEQRERQDPRLTRNELVTACILTAMATVVCAENVSRFLEHDRATEPSATSEPPPEERAPPSNATNPLTVPSGFVTAFSPIAPRRYEVQTLLLHSQTYGRASSQPCMLMVRWQSGVFLRGEVVQRSNGLYAVQRPSGERVNALLFEGYPGYERWHLYKGNGDHFSVNLFYGDDQRFTPEDRQRIMSLPVCGNEHPSIP